MNEDVSVDVFVSDMKKYLDMFEKFWKEGSVYNSKIYPDKTEYNEWMKQFSFLNEKLRNIKETFS